MLTVNGNKVTIEDEMTLRDLLVQLHRADQLCAIEVNKVLIPHQQRNTFTLHDGDTVEIVSLVGGG